MSSTWTARCLSSACTASSSWRPAAATSIPWGSPPARTARGPRKSRNLLMDLGDRAEGFRFLVRDRAGQFTGSFDGGLADGGIDAGKIPPRSPSANACAERFVLTARTEVTDRMLISGERHLRLILTEYETHHNRRRPRPEEHTPEL